MHHSIPFICALFILCGCTDIPSPQSNKELEAKKTIADNITEAQQAQNEYLALQAQRRKES